MVKEYKMALEKVVVVKKKTPLEELVHRHATTSQVKFFLESRGESYNFYKDAHDTYQRGLALTRAAIPTMVRSQVVDKDHLSTFQFSEKDLAVVVGDPGLFVNAAKYVGKQPIVVVNPDRERFDDVFTTCNPDGFVDVLRRVLTGKASYERMTLAEATLENGQTLYALNDFFIGRRTHVSARYEIEHEDNHERQSSSGIIVSTGTGSTGWMTSVRVGAYAIATSNVLDAREVSFSRDADYLIFAVREPFPSKITGTDIIYGEATRESPLQITSNMPEEGVIFSDGIEADYLEFNAGRRATIQPAEGKVYRIKG